MLVKSKGCNHYGHLGMCKMFVVIMIRYIQDSKLQSSMRYSVVQANRAGEASLERIPVDDDESIRPMPHKFSLKCKMFAHKPLGA